MHFKTNIARGILVSPEDEHLLHNYVFHLNDGYPRANVGGGDEYLHKLLVPNSPRVDHRDGNKLDNTRSNLRPCTPAQNGMNRGKNANNTSGYKGVFKEKNKWRAGIAVEGRKIGLGAYTSPEEAALNYDIAAKKYHGEFAQLNFNLELI